MAATFQGNQPLQVADKELYNIIKSEERRQRDGLELIASENFTSRAVMEAVGSCLTNKYSEGYPGKRYYGGNEHIDSLERLCQKRALKAFNLDPEVWGVNVQSYSGSVANFAVQIALLNPNDRFMGLSLTDGGHLSHGFYRGANKVNISSRFFESLPYGVDPITGYVDYDNLEKLAKLFCPKMIIGGSSAYPRDWDWQRLRQISDKCKALLFGDMAHFSGLVAGGVVKNPFEYCDVVSTTTHKSLRSTRAAMIFFKKDLEKKINSAVFPGQQGGPHNHAIAGICAQLKEVCSPAWKEYASQVVKNCRALAEALKEKGHKLATDGTDTHLILWDLRPQKVTGSKLEACCEAAMITLNKNTVHGDKSAFSPGGVRIGTPALTTRGFNEDHFRKVADFLHRALEITIDVQREIFEETGAKKLKAFRAALPKSEKLAELREDVVAFAKDFPMPGVFLPEKNS